MIGDRIRSENGVMSFEALPHTATFDPAAEAWRVSWCPDRLFDEKQATAALELSRLASGYRLVQVPPGSEHSSECSHVCAYQLAGMVVRDERQIRRAAAELGIEPTAAIRSIRLAERADRDRTRTRDVEMPQQPARSAPVDRPFRILVTGSRQWSDTESIRESLEPYRGRGAVVVHGDARGADRIAAAVWRFWGEQVEAHPANWARDGRGAGIVRNAAMVDLGADVCLAFIRDGSAGATHTATTAERAGIETHCYTTYPTRAYAMSHESGWSW